MVTAVKDKKKRKAAQSTASKKQPGKTEKKDRKKDLSTSYNKFKEYDGGVYSGMRIGRSHHWKYDAGDWRETKITLTYGKYLMP